MPRTTPTIARPGSLRHRPHLEIDTSIDISQEGTTLWQQRYEKTPIQRILRSHCKSNAGTRPRNQTEVRNTNVKLLVGRGKDQITYYTTFEDWISYSSLFRDIYYDVGGRPPNGLDIDLSGIRPHIMTIIQNWLQSMQPNSSGAPSIFASHINSPTRTELIEATEILGLHELRNTIDNLWTQSLYRWKLSGRKSTADYKAESIHQWRSLSAFDCASDGS